MMTNFIGRGEKTAIAIFELLLKLQSMNGWQLIHDGIYTQVPLPKLLIDEYITDLNPIHVKSPVDIVLVINGRKIAVYVNGADHASEIKSKNDAVRYRMLRGSGVEVMVLPHYECIELFKEKINETSIAEIKYYLSQARIPVI